MGSAVPNPTGPLGAQASPTADYLGALDAAIAQGEAQQAEFERSQQTAHTQNFAAELAKKNVVSILGLHGIFPIQNEYGDQVKFNDIAEYFVLEEGLRDPAKINARIEELTKAAKGGGMKKRATIDTLLYAVMQCRAQRDGIAAKIVR